MPLFPAHGLAEAIVLELREGPLETAILVRQLRAHGWHVTVQGVYKALQLLREEEIALLHRGEVSLNVRWLQRVERFLSFTQHAYFDSEAGAGSFLNLRDGERITYSFKNPVFVDAFWNHVLYLLLELLPELDRWYAYIPHHWFLLARRKEELALQQFMKKRECRYLLTVGSRLPLDRAVANDFDGVTSQYYMLEKPLFSSRYYLNIIGDFLIEAQYDQKVADLIEAFYQSHKSMTPSALTELEAIVKTPGRATLTISRNHRKAQKWSTLFEKNFYFGRASIPATISERKHGRSRK